jgi:arylsulfatase A-like enzyme
VLRPNCADLGEYEATIRDWLARYYAMIENLDHNIGRLMDTLKALPRFEDTMTVYFSDHGEHMGSHGRAQRKEHPHEESIGIPAIFHWPGKIPAQRSVDNHLFSLVDLMPTTLGLAGVDIPSHNQGIDFSPALLGKPFDSPEDVLLEMVGNPRWNMDFLDWRGLVTRQWKYAYYETGKELLFNLAEDPYEMNNLALTMRGKCDEMKQLLLKRLEQTREPYFDVLINSDVTAPEAIDIGPEKGTFNHCYNTVI